jgi:uncharacterized protein YaiL (DUF2058 family)
MSDSLRDQLLGLGFKPAPKPEKPARTASDQRRESGANPGANQRAHPPRKTGGKPADGKQADGRPADNRDRRDRGPRPTPSGQPQAAHAQTPRHQKPGAQTQNRKPPRTQEEMDLAKAYAIRAQREKEERIEAERVKQEEARLRREAKAKLAEFLKDKGLNDPAADIARHFAYGTKIKRIYVNAEQLKALNAGELGVVQLDGRYLLVTVDVLTQAEVLFAASVALKVDPNAPAGDDPYSDPQYQVPDDLVW